MAAETIAERLAARIVDAASAVVDPEVIHAVERVLFDSLGCALGALDSPAVAALSKWAKRIAGAPHATIWGSGEKSSTAGAAITNCTMTRDLDLNDTYFSINPAHASDNIGACIALAEAEDSTTAELIKAILIAFEVQMRGCEFTRTSFFKERGWDQTLLVTIASAAAAGMLLKLDRQSLAHALSIAACYPTLGEVRVGQISMMKSVSAGLSASHGIEAAYLAKEGVAGTLTAFEGPRGLAQLVLGDCDWDTLVAPFEDWRLPRTCLKRYPAAYIIHSAIDAAILLRQKHGFAPEEVEAVTVHAFGWLIEDMVNGMGGRSRYDIDARETADHSLPYCVAVALVDGRYDIHQLNVRRWEAPEVAAMISRVKCVHDESMDARFPPDRPSRVTVRLRDGRQLTEELPYPKGDYRNPFSDTELAGKFRALTGAALSTAQQQRLMECALGFSRSSVSELVRALVVKA